MSSGTPPASTSQPAAGRPSWRDRLRAVVRHRYFWPAVCALQLVLLAVVFWCRPRTVSRPAVELPPPAIHLPPPDPDATAALPAGTPDLPRGDTLAGEGRWDLALRKYLGGDPAAARPDAVRYRVALAQEALGQWEPALEAYRALAGRTSEPRTLAAAQVGQARVWVYLRQPGQARVLLCELLLRSGQAALREQPCLDDARYLLALALTHEAAPQARPGPLQDAVVPSHAAEWPLGRMLAWAAPVNAETENSAVPAGPALSPDVLWQVQRLGELPEQHLVTAALRQADAGELFQRLARETNLEPTWTERARQTVADRKINLIVEDLPLLDALRTLTGLLGLTWKLEGNKLQLGTEAEATKATLDQFRSATARLALREAVLNDPGHVLTAAVYLELGNLDVAEGRFAEAAAWYEQVLRDTPRGPGAVIASYNLGLIRRRLGNLDGARTAFYRVVDQAPAHELAPQAYFWIGRSYLEDAQPVLAVPCLRRALVCATGTAGQPAAAVLLAAGYLLTEDPEAATAVLGASRQTVSQEPYRQTTAFLEMLARVRAAKDRRQAQREAGDLLAAALEFRDASVLGMPGKLLLGQAYRELGLPAEMTAVYQQALPQARGPLAEEMTYRIAETLFTEGKPEAAQQLLRPLAERSECKWAAAAQFRLAEIALHESRPEEVLEWSRKLLATAPNNKQPLLRLMGRAYDQLGEHRQAARCFAGQTPD